MLVGTDPDGLRERSNSARIRYPEDRILRWFRIRIAAQVGQVDKASGRDAIDFDPFKCWTELGSFASLGLYPDRLRRVEVLNRLDGCIAIDNVNRFGLCLLRNR